MRYVGQFRLAHELKKDLYEIMGWPGPLTHRQYLAWQAWLDWQWAKPKLSDYYLMRVAQRVQQVLSKSPNRIKLEDQKVEFQGHKEEKPPMSKEAAVALSKARWFGWFGAFKRAKQEAEGRSGVKP